MFIQAFVTILWLSVSLQILHSIYIMLWVSYDVATYAIIVVLDVVS